jgi:hypothetical protein
MKTKSDKIKLKKPTKKTKYLLGKNQYTYSDGLVVQKNPIRNNTILTITSKRMFTMYFLLFL